MSGNTIVLIKTKPDSLIPEATGNKHSKGNAFYVENKYLSQKIEERSRDLSFLDLQRIYLITYQPSRNTVREERPRDKVAPLIQPKISGATGGDLT